MLSSRSTARKNESLPQYVSNNFPDTSIDYFKPPHRPQPNLPFVEYSKWSRFWRSLGALILFPYTFFTTRLIDNDEVGLILDSDGQPRLLGPGWHTLFHPLSRFMGTKKVSEAYIQLGTLKIISVKIGELCHCLDTATGEQLLLTEGRHVLNSATMICKGFINLNDPSNIYSPESRIKKPIGDEDLRVIRVETGQMGIVNRAGKLETLEPGLHVITPPDKYSGLVVTTQQILEFEKATIESADFVPLNIKADVFYTIKDPLQALRDIGKNIVKFIADKAKATLTAIIRSQSYMSVAQDRTSTYAKQNTKMDTSASSSSSSSSKSEEQLSDESYVRPAPSAPRLTVKTVHDLFMEQINDEVMRNHGLEISNIRVESLEIADSKLAQQFSAQAIISAETQTKTANLQAQALIQQQTALNAAETKRIESEAQAEATQRQAGAEAIAIIKKAEAEARAVELKAEADKKRVCLEGEAQRTFAESIKDHPFAQKLAALQLQTEALKGATVHLSQLPNGFSQAPFSFFCSPQQQAISLQAGIEPNNERAPAMTQ